MTRVLLDCDGVLSDFIGGVLPIVREITGRTFTHADVTEFDFCRALGISSGDSSLIKREIACRRLAHSPAVLAGAIVGVEALRRIADVYIVTSPWNSDPFWMSDREAWLLAKFGISHSRVIHCSAKHLVSGDFLVDDKTSTLVDWVADHPHGTAVQWQTPHNRNDDWRGESTCDWDELLSWVQR